MQWARQLLDITDSSLGRLVNKGRGSDTLNCGFCVSGHGYTVRSCLFALLIVGLIVVGI